MHGESDTSVSKIDFGCCTLLVVWEDSNFKFATNDVQNIQKRHALTSENRKWVLFYTEWNEKKELEGRSLEMGHVTFGGLLFLLRPPLQTFSHSPT